MKKTLLTLMASLLLGGAAVAQHYTAPNAHSKSSNTPIVAAVTVDGAAAATGAELAVYVDDELRGLATTAQLVDGKFWVQVYYDTEKPSDTDPTTNVPNTEDLTFKLWDPTGEGTELTDYTLTYTDNGTTLTALTTSEEGWGTPGNPVVIDFATVQTMTQQISMSSGWNWWSSYIELDNNSLDALENGLGNNGVQIQGRGGIDIMQEMMGYVFWEGDLDRIVNEQMYMIQTNAVCNINLSGPRASANNHQIPINKGWNWIGFPSSQSMSIDDAFLNFTPESGDQIKGRAGFATYTTFGEYGWWEPDQDGFHMEPGQGYMYYSNSNDAKTLVYHSGNRSDISTDNKNNLVFQPLQEKFANNMTVTAVVELDGKELCADDFEIAAFVGDQCRGSVKLKYVEPLGRFEAFLLIFGQADETLRFVLSDGKEVSWSNEHLKFNVNDIIGTTTEPFVLHFGTLGTNDNLTIVNVYPNPSNDIFNIQGENINKIEVVDNYGQIIISKEIRNDITQINLRDKASGAYLLRVVTSNGIYINKIIKK